VTSEELRSFLTSVFVRESKSRTLGGRFRSWTAERNHGTVARIRKAEQK
jgi:hypothetical protein